MVEGSRDERMVACHYILRGWAAYYVLILGFLTKRRRQLLGGKFVEVSSEEMGMDGWMFRVEELQVEGRYSVARAAWEILSLCAKPRAAALRRMPPVGRPQRERNRNQNRNQRHGRTL